MKMTCKAIPHYCVQFQGRLPRNHDKIRIDQERIDAFYQMFPVRSEFVERIHCFGSLFAFVYSFTLFAILFHYIYTHPIQKKPIT
jgi:hypothetical protein